MSGSRMPKQGEQVYNYPSIQRRFRDDPIPARTSPAKVFPLFWPNTVLAMPFFDLFRPFFMCWGMRDAPAATCAFSWSRPREKSCPSQTKWTRWRPGCRIQTTHHRWRIFGTASLARAFFWCLRADCGSTAASIFSHASTKSGSKVAVASSENSWPQPFFTSFASIPANANLADPKVAEDRLPLLAERHTVPTGDSLDWGGA